MLINRTGLSLGLAGSILFAGLGGCASGRTGNNAATSDALEFGPESPASEPMTPEIELAAAHAGERRWLVLEGKLAGREILDHWREENGGFVMTRQTGGETDLLEEQAYRLDESKGLVLERSVNHARGVIVEFTPRLVAMPARLEPGTTVTQLMQLRLPLVKNPKKLREQGTATRELALVGTQMVRFRGQEAAAFHVREVMTNGLNAASAVRTTDRWLTPGAGPIAERYEEEVKAFGITVEKTRRVMVLLAPGVTTP